MKAFIILSVICYSIFFTHNSFAQKTAIEHYQEGKVYEQKAKFTKAFKQYQLAANMGLANAQISLASFYETGLGGEESPSKSFEMYQKAALQGEDFARYKVARSYETGRGVQKNIPKAIYEYLILWENNYQKAGASLKKLNVDATADKEHFAYIHYKAEQKIAKFQCKLGLKYLKQNDFEKAQVYLEQAAQQKYTTAQTILAELYMEGKYFKKNNYRAIKYYVQAANQGSKLAAQKAAQHDLNLWLLPQNLDYLIYKARNGDAFSQFGLYKLYFNGEKVKKDNQLAFKYCEQAAKQGHQEAIERLAEMYQEGIGTDKNITKSLEYYMTLAKMGLPKAQHQVGDYYLKNKKYTVSITFYLKASNSAYTQSKVKIEQNPFLMDYADKKSKDYLFFQAQKGEVDSQYRLACYYFDQGERKGLKWLFKAAEQGSQDANLLLGKIYIEGEKLPKDIKKACDFFAKAELGGLQIDSKYKDICKNESQVAKY